MGKPELDNPILQHDRIQALPRCRMQRLVPSVPVPPGADRVDQQALHLFQGNVGRLRMCFDKRSQNDLCRSARRTGGGGLSKNLVSGHREHHARDPSAEPSGTFPTCQAKDVCQSLEFGPVRYVGIVPASEQPPSDGPVKIETMHHQKGFTAFPNYCVTRLSHGEILWRRAFASRSLPRFLGSTQNGRLRPHLSVAEFARIQTILVSNHAEPGVLRLQLPADRNSAAHVRRRIAGENRRVTESGDVRYGMWRR